MTDSKSAHDPVDPDAAARLDGRAGGGDSGGGPYPNPHSGKEGGDKDGFMAKGGQTGMAYHGHGQLGDESTGDNANSAAGGTRSNAGEDPDDA
jgi:hypothetical protein